MVQILHSRKLKTTILRMSPIVAGVRSALCDVGTVILIACLTLAALAGSMLAYFTPLAPTSLTVTVEPVADTIRIDGMDVGSGTLVRLDQPPTGMIAIEATKERFLPHNERLQVHRVGPNAHAESAT